MWFSIFREKAFVSRVKRRMWLFEQAALLFDVVMPPSNALLGYRLANRHGRVLGWLNLYVAAFARYWELLTARAKG
jgi:hypothetical protein